jgi:hypothetical protein
MTPKLSELVFFFATPADLPQVVSGLVTLAKADAPGFARHDPGFDIPRAANGDQAFGVFKAVRVFDGYSALRWIGADRGELFALAATLHATERGTVQIR